MTILNTSVERKTVTTRTDMTCTVCRRHRAQLRPRKSKLLPNTPMWLCNECFDAKREPRWVVIMVARDPSQGIAAVRDYIKGHKYYGEKIQAEEILPDLR